MVFRRVADEVPLRVCQFVARHARLTHRGTDARASVSKSGSVGTQRQKEELPVFGFSREARMTLDHGFRGQMLNDRPDRIRAPGFTVGDLECFLQVTQNVGYTEAGAILPFLDACEVFFQWFEVFVGDARGSGVRGRCIGRAAVR